MINKEGTKVSDIGTTSPTGNLGFHFDNDPAISFYAFSFYFLVGFTRFADAKLHAICTRNPLDVEGPSNVDSIRG